MFWQFKTCDRRSHLEGNVLCPAPSKPELKQHRDRKCTEQRNKGSGDLCPVTHHIWSLIFFPLSSTVLILKSTPMRGGRKKHMWMCARRGAFPALFHMWKNQGMYKFIKITSCLHVKGFWDLICQCMQSILSNHYSWWYPVTRED